jgi:hypothetical protein
MRSRKSSRSIISALLVLIVALAVPASAGAGRPVQLSVSQGKHWIEQIYQAVAEREPLEYEYRFRVAPCKKIARLKVACEIRSTQKPPGEACEALRGMTVGARYNRHRHGYEPYVAAEVTAYDECHLTS